MHRFAQMLFMLILAAGLTACGDRFPDFNYRMTIHVGDDAYSSVRRVEQEKVTSIVDSSGSTVRRSLQGEAVIIDHPNGRTYYALLSKPGDADYATLIVGVALSPHISDVSQSGGHLDEIAARSRAMTEVEGPRELPRQLPSRNGRPPYEAWPMFVTFSDPSDPTTVREVDPEDIGVSKITIEITDEDVTTGIEERLPTFGPEFEIWVRGLKYGDPRLGILGGFHQGTDQ